MMNKKRLLALLLMLVLVMSLVPAMNAEAAEGDYSGEMVHYEFLHSSTDRAWFTTELGHKIDLVELLPALRIPIVDGEYPNKAKGYSIVSNSNSVRVIEEGDKVYLNPFSEAGANKNEMAIITITYPNGVALSFTARTGALDTQKEANNTLCIIYDEDGKFYLWDEVNKEKRSGALPYQTIEEAIDGGYGVSALYPNANFHYPNVKILINKTYVADYVGPGGTYEKWDNVAPNGTVYNSFTARIERHEGFTGPLVYVATKYNRPLYVGAGVTIDNKSPEGTNYTAVEIVNTQTDGEDNSGLIILHGGRIEDSAALEDGLQKYRGRGVYIHSTIHTNPENVTELIENQGGCLELDAGCSIAGFADGIVQEYGMTRLKNNGHAPSSGISVDGNIRTITMYHHTYIGKWDIFETLPYLKIYLHDVQKWQSGDIVMGSGYYWDTTHGNQNSADNNNAGDLRWSVVKENDENSISFQNSADLETAMNIEYYNAHPNEVDQYEDQLITPGVTPITDPYPVLRFQKQSVYNVQLEKWYFTLGEAVADSGLRDGHELVFYDSTSESGTVTISKSVTIRSSYDGEECLGTGNLMVEDNRAGSPCTANWNATSGSGIVINNGATVNFKGSANGNTCGTLTLNADGKGRVIENKGTMNMEDGITLTNGSTAGYGGAVLNVSGTLNITGGTISNNSADLGDGIYQNGVFNLSGSPEFSGQTDDVYLPATATSDTASGFNVITKAGEFTFTTPIKVMLGEGNANYYDGRNVVESSSNNQVVNDDLQKFTLNNATGYDQEYFSNFAFVFTAQDATPNANKNEGVLELDIELLVSTGSLKVTKNVDKEYEGDTLPDDSFSFTVTGPNNYTNTFTLKNEGSITIENLPVGEYTIVEELGTNSQYTSDWTDNTITVEIEAGETFEATCTNTYAKQVGDLTITKDVTNTVEAGQSFVFHVYNSSNEKVMTVVIPGEGSVTIKNLPVGTYKVVEDTAWSQRYDVSPTTAEVNATVTGGGTAEAKFTNTLDETTKWLTGDCYCKNLWETDGFVEKK